MSPTVSGELHSPSHLPTRSKSFKKSFILADFREGDSLVQTVRTKRAPLFTQAPQ